MRDMLPLRIALNGFVINVRRAHGQRVNCVSTRTAVSLRVGITVENPFLYLVLEAIPFLARRLVLHAVNYRAAGGRAPETFTGYPQKYFYPPPAHLAQR